MPSAPKNEPITLMIKQETRLNFLSGSSIVSLHFDWKSCA